MGDFYMSETITKKKFQIGDIAVLENQNGEQFLYDVKEKRLIGNGDFAYKSSIKVQSDYYSGLVGDHHTGMILQKTEDGKRCRIYDALHKKMIVENWEYVASSEDGDMDLVAVLKNPETQKYHIFHSCFMGKDG